MAEHDTALTIGIDARAATEEVAGRGRVVRELLARPSQRVTTRTATASTPRERWEEDLDDRFAWRLGPASGAAWHPWAARAIARECDVCLATNSYLTAILARVPTATIVYDLAALDPATRSALRSAVIERAGAARRRVAVGRAAGDLAADR